MEDVKKELSTVDEKKPLRSELEVYKELESRILTHTINIKRVIKYTDLSRIAPEEIKTNEIWCAIDFLPKKKRMICGKRENVVLFHFFIGSSLADGLYVVDEELIAALEGYKGAIISSCKYQDSSQCYKEKAWDAWTKYCKFKVEWIPD